MLLDHQPCELEAAQSLGIDLQMSGHTHAGQLFPMNYLVGITNEYGYGHLEKNGYNLIVSSGYGVWGFPFRFGSRSELVSIKLTGK